MFRLIFIAVSSVVSAPFAVVWIPVSISMCIRGAESSTISRRLYYLPAARAPPLICAYRDLTASGEMCRISWAAMKDGSHLLRPHGWREAAEPRLGRQLPPVEPRRLVQLPPLGICTPEADRLYRKFLHWRLHFFLSHCAHLSSPTRDKMDARREDA